MSKAKLTLTLALAGGVAFILWQYPSNLDRDATARLKEMFTPDESALFDPAYLGVMGVDLGGVGVDKSNYPPGFLGEN